MNAPIFQALDLWTAYCLSRRGPRTLSTVQIVALLNKLAEVSKAVPSTLQAVSQLSTRLEALKNESPVTVTPSAPINWAFLTFFKAHASELGDVGREILARVSIEIEKDKSS